MSVSGRAASLRVPDCQSCVHESGSLRWSLAADRAERTTMIMPHGLMSTTTLLLGMLVLHQNLAFVCLPLPRLPATIAALIASGFSIPA